MKEVTNSRRPVVEASWLDRAIGAVAPGAGVRRLHNRFQFNSLVGGYKGASKKRRATENWSLTGGSSADGALLMDLPVLRDRSRDLQRNNPLAAGAINTKVTSVIGTGLTPKPQIDAEFLGLNEDDAEAWQKEAYRLWLLWSESEECDITRTQTFAEQQELAFRGTLEAGDIFVLKRFLERSGSPFGLKLQMIEGDRVSNPGWQRDTAILAGGVEVDGDGAPAFYHVTNVHPGDRARGAKSLKWDAIPVFGVKSGRRNVLHLFRRLRPGQTRGVPDLAPVIEALKELGDYTEAELQATVISSFFTVFVKSESGDGLDVMEPAGETGGVASDKDYKMAPAAILDLGVGEEIETANPGRPNDSFDPFVMAISRQIGVALELPFEILVKHFTASYSAARAALLEAWKYYRGRRAWMATRFCQPVYEDVITEAVARGWLAAPGFFQSEAIRKAYLTAYWKGDSMPSIDPKKENEADAIAEDRGWKTADENTAEKTGGDWERKHRQRAKEERMRRADGVGPAPKQAALPAPEPDDGGADDKTEDETENVA